MTASPEPDSKRQRVESDATETAAVCPENAPTSIGRTRYTNSDSVPELLKLYYGRLFPWQDLYKWLAYGNDGKHRQADCKYFQRREFCFTMEGDIFVRYQSFKDGQEFVSALKQKCPTKIDIGPLYTVDPAKRAAYQGNAGFQPVERELVFDIDLTDYDDVRTCGKGGHICQQCWPLMAVAIQIIDEGLREDFGFQHILWVFSGRRGIHCWVCDRRARLLTDEQRSAVAGYFSIYKGKEKDTSKVFLGNHNHPAVLRAWEILEATWLEHVLPQQRIFQNPETIAEVLKMVPHEDVVRDMRQRWSATDDMDIDNVSIEINLQRWRELEIAVKAKAGKQQWLQACLKDIVFAFVYPRLDVEVSKKMNHLLKAPFCIHPKTGKLCVPLDPADVWDFNPDTVATLAQMLNELDDAANKDCDKGEEWQHTAMAEALKTFKQCFLQSLNTANQHELAEKARAVNNAPTLAW